MRAPILFRRRVAGGAIACFGFLLLGWGGLAVPSLVRQVEEGFGQSDAGLGLFYFVNALTYAIGSLLGGVVTERFGRRSVLALATVLGGVGFLVQGIVPSWEVFLLAGIPRGLGTGALDGGLSGMVLDLYPDARGRALNAAHLFFALGALAAPFAFGALVDAGVAWQLVLIATGVVSLALAVPLAVTDLAGGHRPHEDRAGDSRRLGLAPPIIALGVAIGLYVAAEMGVSSWLVRFLASSPLTLATSALGLFWTGLMLGRLASARFADRFDHLALAVAAALVTSVALVGAVLIPVVPVSIVLFGVVGFACGPIYPLIVAVAAERYPDRTSAVSGILTAAGVVGSVVYPPLMGFMSVTIGLPAAMFGTAVIGFACAGAIVLAGRMGRRADRVPGETRAA